MATAPRPLIGSVVRSVCGREVVRIARQHVPWFTDEEHVMAQARGVGVPTPDVLGVEQVDHDGELLSFSIASDSCRAVRSTSSLASCRRTYQVMDLEGHQWTFAEHVADVELEVAHLHGER